MTPCATRHHSRPCRRQWTIPGTMSISMLPSARQKARTRCQESRLRPRVSSRNLGTGDCMEIAPAHARSQSRLLTPLPSFLPRRGKHGDTHSARNRPLATKWSRMMTCRAWVQIISAAHNARLPRLCRRHAAFKASAEPPSASARAKTAARRLSCGRM